MRLLASCWLALLTGCATANSSANSGASSNGSANSSAQSGQSSGASGQSSQASNNSSNGSRNSSDSNASSRASIQGTTDNASLRNSVWVTAGSSLLATTGVGVGLLIYFVNRAKHPPEPERLEQRAKQAQAWLRANQAQLEEDLALGAGPAVDDLASAAEIRVEHRARFGQLLQRHRLELLDAARGARRSVAEALRFLGRVGDLARADGVLLEDVRGFEARHPEAG